jgi:probable F420-dependent oxidoreductase
VRAPRFVLILSENWTMVSPRDPLALIRVAQEAEDAGFDGVMVSEHLALGPSASSGAAKRNPRDYDLPGNQDPATPWPYSLGLLSAVAAATERVRLIAAAIIAPLRHPVALAKELATLDLLSAGRLVVQPTVSWHADEYAALGVDFARRGALLDEHLAAWRALWGPSPASFAGENYRFSDVYSEPKPHHSEGPALWFGGASVHPRLVGRLVDYGQGFHPLGRPSAEELERLRSALAEAGRELSSLELVGGMRGTFEDADGVADLARAMEAIPPQLEAGYTTFSFKPSQFVDDPDEVGALCREVIRRGEAFG